MPYVTVKMLEGRTEEQKKALAEKVTAAVVETTGAPASAVVVFIEEMSKNHYAIAGKRLSDE
ncbi:2-hydroxymuconate tautomerase [Ectobacillus panaciterrae]|uniref:2-hydroxymuconate tautomerase n=1 Tax=Ectobacillus panaciterrae TaxID=363872 RepID=UPI0004054DA1|nr:2-hydroxymuconate tautomerase [Ectobacillus panaciterrae]